MRTILRNFYVRRLLLLLGVYVALSVALTFTSGLLSQARWVLLLAAFVLLVATVISVLRRIFAALRGVARRANTWLRG